ncbi:MAG: sulfatase-like hydrolase/transferase [Bacteroidota bacterium]|nr:sulfatase-like hydrolase/transferase [Bacteroidota bacterium]
MKKNKGITQNFSNLNKNITQSVKSNMPLQLAYMLGVYFLCVFFMMIFRVLIFFVHCATTLSDLSFVMLFRSLLQGIRFDSTMICGILSPFLLLMLIFSIINFNRRWIYRPLHILLSIVCCLLFLISFLDAAYFTYFQSHINVVVLSWMRTPKYLFDVILHSPAYLFYILAFLGILAWFAWLMYCLYNATLFKTIPPYNAKQPLAKTLIIGCLLCLICFVGMRGRITEKKPLTLSAAYFSDNDFFNQLGVSPMFSIFKSYQEEKNSQKDNIAYIDPVKGREIVGQEFANRDDVSFAMPTLKEGTNILMVILEDVTLENVNGKEMPALYNISKQSLSFNNVYADGEYIYNGLYSILFSYPNIFSSNSMISTIIPKMEGLPTLLKQHGYKTFFFTSKEQSTDNTTRFLLANDIDIIFSGRANDLKQDGKVLSSTNQPFFACVLVSNDKTKNNLRSIDNKISQILSEAKKYAWFKNTLIIFAGANGYAKKVPVYFYAKNIFSAEKNNTLACQMDITPTIMAMMDNSYRNKTLGFNIYSQRRSFAYSAKKDEIMVVSPNATYTWNKNKKENIDIQQDSTLKIEDGDTIYLPTLSSKDLSEKMKEYVFSMYQTAKNNTSQMKIKVE